MAVKILNGVDVIGNMNITASDVPNLDANKITSGTIGSARIPNLAASKITSGTLGTARIPNLDAGKITSGTFHSDRMPDLSSTYATASHNHDSRYASIAHNHDSRYYQKADTIQVFTTGKNLDEIGTYIHAKEDGGWAGGSRLAGAHNGYGAISMHLHTGNYYGQIHLSANTGEMGIRFQNGSDSWSSIYKVWTSNHFDPNTFLTSVSWNDVTGKPTLDNYGSWNLKTNGVQRTTVGSGGDLNLVAGTNVSLSYSAGGTVTINSSETDTLATVVARGQETAQALVVTAVDSGNPAAAANSARLSGYGLLGNRGNFYLTNGGGVVQIGVGATHNANPVATFGNQIYFEKPSWLRQDLHLDDNAENSPALKFVSGDDTIFSFYKEDNNNTLTITRQDNGGADFRFVADPADYTQSRLQIGTGYIDVNKINSWDTAYGWGNHATQGYLTSVPSEYLTQTEGDARYLQSLPSHNHDGRYLLIGGDGGNFSNVIDTVDSDVVLGFNNYTSAPYANHSIVTTFVNQASAGRRAQLFHADSPAGGLWWRPRQGDATGWHDWQKVWTSYNFDPNTFLTSIPSEYLTQTEGDARYLQSVPNTLRQGTTLLDTAIEFYDEDAGGDLSWVIGADDRGGRGQEGQNALVFRYNQGVRFTDTGWRSEGTEAMLIDDSGRVGINTSPANLNERLEVGGNAVVTGTVYANGGNSNQWNTAHGWGDHAQAGYLTSLPSHNHDDRYYTETEVNNLIAQHTGWQTFSNFVNGTLVRTDIDASVTNGDSFLLRVVGKSYQTDHSPFDLLLQGYIYNNTFISYSAIVNSTAGLGDIKILELDGQLCFWWARFSYWNSFEIYVTKVSGGDTTPSNRVVAVEDVAEPASTLGKKVSVTPYESWTTKEFGQSSVNNWNTAYGWGNHANAGYLTSYSETDTLDSVADRGATTNQAITTGGITATYGNFGSTGSNPQVRIFTENASASIADTFTDTTTDKSYIYFNAGTSSNDPAYIMHETSESTSPDERNEGVLHLVPSDDNNSSDYVSIHGTNDPDALRLTTTGKIETSSSYQLQLVSGNSNIWLNDGVEVNDYIRHRGDSDTHIVFSDNRIRLIAGGTTKFDSNNTYVTTSGYNNSNWDTAYGWGDHSTQGYLTSVPSHSAALITSGTLASARLSGTYNISVSGSSASSNRLNRDDNRTISPSEDSNGSMSFGFTSWTNDNTGGWADYLHLRSYTDSSGGNDNLVMFSKDSIEMRIWQQSYNSSTPYANFRDVAFKDELQTPAITSNGSTPSLNSGITAAEVRSLIGAQAAGTFNTVIGTDSDINTSGSTIIDNIYVTDGVITSMGTRTLTAADLGIAQPAPPAAASCAVVGDTIEVSFDPSPNTVDYYQVWASQDGGSYALISQVPKQDFAPLMTVVDTAFSVSGTRAYRVYAVRHGIYSDPATTSRSYTQSALEPVNMNVVAMEEAFFIQWDAPASRFVDHYEVWVDTNATQSSLSRSNATLAYSGNNTFYMHNASNNEFHQFWVEITES